MTVSQTRNVCLPLMKLVRWKGVPILRQLQLEEQLLRTSSENWCIVNDGTNHPTIVMGISGKPAKLLKLDTVLNDRIPVIKRFSGGGTVIVDHGTIFVSFICNKDAIPGLQPYPQPIMSWSSQLYASVFKGFGDFNLRENDYVFGNHKFGGNAQSITKNRWIHHTSFLWDYEARNMAYLEHPARTPDYRKVVEKVAFYFTQIHIDLSLLKMEASDVCFQWLTFCQVLCHGDHLEFICHMKDYIPRSVFIDRTIEALETHFSARLVQLEGMETNLNSKFAYSTKLLTEQELEAEAGFESHFKKSLSHSL